MIDIEMICAKEVRIPVQVRIFLLKSEIVLSQSTNYRFVSSYTTDLKQQNKEINTAMKQRNKDEVSSPVK